MSDGKKVNNYETQIVIKKAKKFKSTVEYWNIFLDIFELQILKFVTERCNCYETFVYE